jgi:hypothetical protein
VEDIKILAQTFSAFQAIRTGFVQLDTLLHTAERRDYDIYAIMLNYLSKIDG